MFRCRYFECSAATSRSLLRSSCVYFSFLTSSSALEPPGGSNAIVDHIRSESLQLHATPRLPRLVPNDRGHADDAPVTVLPNRILPAAVHLNPVLVVVDLRVRGNDLATENRPEALYGRRGVLAQNQLPRRSVLGLCLRIAEDLLRPVVPADNAKTVIPFNECKIRLAKLKLKSLGLPLEPLPRVISRARQASGSSIQLSR